LLASNAAVEKKIAELETQPGHRVVADVSSHINGFGNTWVGISGPHHEFVARRLALARHMLALGPGQPVFERGWTVPLPRVPGAYRYPTAEQLTRFRSGYRGGESHGGWHIQRSREGQGRRDEPMTVLLEGSQFAALPDALDENMTFADMTAQNWNGWQRELVAYMHSLVPLVKSFMRGNNIMVREMLAALGVDHGWGSEAVADEKAPVSSEMYSAFVLQLPVMMAGRCGQLVDFFNAVQLEDEAKEAENWRSRLVHESWGQGRFVAIPPAYSVGFELIALQQVMRHCAGLYGVGGGLPMLDFRNELNSLDDDTVRGGLLNGYPRMGISRADHLAVRGYVKVFDDFELGPPLTQIDRFMLGMSAEDAGQLTALQGCEWPRL
jgi:hypothetical protein